MHTPSPRIQSALAFDRGEEYDPGQPLSEGALADLELTAQARPVIGEDGPYERARQRARERRMLAAVPDWFSVDDLLRAPWEAVHGELV